MASGTIKEQVLQTARQDPFLTIDEIAEKVNTTSRYVRTILSESKVSLMELRKTYAKNMEKRLKGSGEWGAHDVQRSVKVDPQLRLTKVQDSRAARLLDWNPDEELWLVSQLQRINDIPVFVELITYKELTLRGDTNSLRQMLIARDSESRLVQKEQWVEVRKNDPALHQMLGTDPAQPLLKLCTLLYIDEEPVGLEIQWFPSEGILLKWPGGLIDITAEYGS